MESQHDNNEAATAAQWMARRDRGLSPREQDAYLQWVMEVGTRGAIMAELERTWTRLDAVRHWRPAHSDQPNPDLLATRRPRRRPWALAAVAAVLAVAMISGHAFRDQAERSAQIVPGPERLVLEDGSLVELNTGAQVEVRYTQAERRLRLVSGEAHFTVAKNPDRPFIVEVDDYAVRAVGTAFMVQQARSEVSVTVTEGHVRLGLVPAKAEGTAAGGSVLAELLAGHQATAAPPRHTGDRPEVAVRHLTPLELDAAMAWRGIRLEFEDLPLGEVVEEFNRFNVRRLVVDDAETAQLRVGGNFRADNLAAFVRLLDTGFGVSAESQGEVIVLRRR